MNRWASHNPELYEAGIGPLDAAIDRWDSKEEEPCCVCGEYMVRMGGACKRCKASMEEDRLERESNR